MKDIGKQSSRNDFFGGAGVKGTNSGELASNTEIPLSNVLEAMPVPAALVNWRTGVVAANQAFYALVDRADGLFMSQGRLTVHDPAGQREFLRHLAACLSEDFSDGSGFLRIARMDSWPYFLGMFPILRRREDEGLAALMVVDFDNIPAVDPDMLVELFQLTSAEAKVAAELAAGRSVAEIARQKGGSGHTAYNQIKSIVAKTGLKGHADIARRVFALSCLFKRRQ